MGRSADPVTASETLFAYIAYSMRRARARIFVRPQAVYGVFRDDIMVTWVVSRAAAKELTGYYPRSYIQYIGRV